MATDSSDSRRLLPGRQNSHQMDRIYGKSQKSTNQNRSLHWLMEQTNSRMRRLLPLEALSHRIGDLQRNASSMSWGIFGSLKILILKSKLNVLILCGFLAILVNYVTRKHVGALNFIDNPFCVVIGWMMGQPLDLNFHLFETASLLMTVLVIAFLLQDGTSNCLKGLMLFLCYLIVAASIYVHAEQNPDGKFLTSELCLVFVQHEISVNMH